MDFCFYKVAPGKQILIPLYISSINAGFPSPAEGYIEKTLDLNEHLITNPSSTFLVRVSGSSMKDANLLDGDVLIVDKSIKAENNNIIVAVVDQEFTVKRLSILKNGSIHLLPENDKYKPIVIIPEMDFRIWGVVTYIIHSAT